MAGTWWTASAKSSLDTATAAGNRSTVSLQRRATRRAISTERCIPMKRGLRHTLECLHANCARFCRNLGRARCTGRGKVLGRDLYRESILQTSEPGESGGFGYDPLTLHLYSLLSARPWGRRTCPFFLRDRSQLQILKRECSSGFFTGLANMNSLAQSQAEPADG